MIYTAIVLAILAAVVDYFVGIKEPWRKIIYFGILILFATGVLQILLLGPRPF